MKFTFMRFCLNDDCGCCSQLKQLQEHVTIESVNASSLLDFIMIRKYKDSKGFKRFFMDANFLNVALEVYKKDTYEYLDEDEHHLTCIEGCNLCGYLIIINYCIGFVENKYTQEVNDELSRRCYPID
jgi:hypothetical protein